MLLIVGVNCTEVRKLAVVMVMIVATAVYYTRLMVQYIDLVSKRWTKRVSAEAVHDFLEAKEQYSYSIACHLYCNLLHIIIYHKIYIHYYKLLYIIVCIIVDKSLEIKYTLASW